jgi:HlyD family secretion protein
MTANRRSGGWKWLVMTAVVAVAAGAWFLLRKPAAEIQYQTASVTRGELIQAVTATGTLNPITNVTVGSQISGNIAKLHADWNSPVKAGQVVAELDPSLYQAIEEQAEGDLANAKANLELQQAEAKRADQLFANKLIAESDHDTALASLHQAQAQVQIKQAALDNAKINLAHCTIYSPVDGVVISRNVDVGQTVAASLSAPVLFIIANDLSRMQIDSNVSEADIGTVEEGQPVDFTVDAFSGRSFHGKVVQVRNSPTNVQNVVTYDAVINVSNPDLKLRPGMTANASIITARRSDVLKVPNAAFRFKPPEPSTNQTFTASWLAKLGLGAKPTAPLPAPKPLGTNLVETATNTPPPLTGNEPPQELQRRVAQMRANGEEVPAEIRAKLRSYYQSGVLQRSGDGNGSHSGGGSSPPAIRTVYLLTPAAPGGEPGLQPVRIRTGITDGQFTEVTDGLKESDQVVTSVRSAAANAAAAATGGASPFGGPRRF